MRGNDIVDISLAATESNWRRKGFLDKLFTPHEKEHITRSDNPGRLVWTYWSMKEAAYKAFTRQSGGRFFAPQKFECSAGSDGNGKVKVGQSTYQTKTYCTPGYIYSVAQSGNELSPALLDHCLYLDEMHGHDPSRHIYAVMIKAYAALTNRPVHWIRTGKDGNGIPFLQDNKERTTIPVSITHHGRYAAFTIS